MATRRTATKAKAAPPPEVDEIEDLDVDEFEEEVVEETPKPASKRRAPARKPPVRQKAPEPEDDDEEEEEPAPAPKRRGRPAKSAAVAEEKPKPAPKRPEVEFGTSWLVDHVNEKCGTSYKPYDLRVLLRKMAKSGELDREVGSDRSRYSFTGPGDAVVKAVVQKVKSGAVEAEKKASLDKLKDKTAAKSNVTPIAKKRGRPAKPKPAPVDEEDDFDEDDVEELD